MWVQTRDGNPRVAFESAGYGRKENQRATNQRGQSPIALVARNITQWDMRRNESDRDFPPVKHIAKFFTPQRSAKNSVCPGNLKPASYIRAL